MLEELRLKEMPYPSELPYYDRVLISDADQFWLRRYPRPGETSDTWMILDQRTRTFREVPLPERYTLLAVWENRMVGLWRDPDDVEHIRVYAFR